MAGTWPMAKNRPASGSCDTCPVVLLSTLTASRPPGAWGTGGRAGGSLVRGGRLLAGSRRAAGCAACRAAPLARPTLAAAVRLHHLLLPQNLDLGVGQRLAAHGAAGLELGKAVDDVHGAGVAAARAGGGGRAGVGPVPLAPARLGAAHRSERRSSRRPLLCTSRHHNAPPPPSRPAAHPPPAPRQHHTSTTPPHHPHRQPAGPPSQVQRLLHGRVAAADDGQRTVAEQWRAAVADGARADALLPELLGACGRGGGGAGGGGAGGARPGAGKRLPGSHSGAQQRAPASPAPRLPSPAHPGS